MSRAILLSTCGDPFITLFCLKLWKERWPDEVNKIYINFNNHTQVPLSVVSEFFDRVASDPNITFIYHPGGIGNGPPQEELLKICKEDLILLLEDDFFIFTPGIVDKYFKQIEDGEYDLIGSPRYSVGEVAQAAQQKYNLDYSGYGDRGFGWWPAGFYCKRSDLLKTDLDFGSKEYKAGEYFKELDHTFEETCQTDTFTWTSVQLRYLGLKAREIPQYHASPYEVEDRDGAGMNWRDGDIPTYIHGGSLSSGWRGYLSGRMPDLSSENAIREIETRVSFWIICSDETPGFEEFKKAYRAGIENLIIDGKLDRDRIDQKVKLYRDLMSI